MFVGVSNVICDVFYGVKICWYFNYRVMVGYEMVYNVMYVLYEYDVGIFLVD